MRILHRVLYLSACLLFTSPALADFTTVTDAKWNETAVRKVLHTFALGGFASDAQIHEWADMPPELAIEEMLTFEPLNPRLSPAEDATVIYNTNLESLQGFWGAPSLANPVGQDRWINYAFLNSKPDGTTKDLSINNLKNTWLQATNTRGINPFLHRVGLYLTNYHMSIRVQKTRPALMRQFYDQAIADLGRSARGEINFFDLLANGAATAAVSRAYRHQYNRFTGGRFYGNDDFAREFHQLFFKIQGVTETGTPDLPGQEYHENVTIEHTAWLLTGMNLTREDNAYGSTNPIDWYLYPIDFYSTRNVNNHHKPCLEIYNAAARTANICGDTAEEKLFNLAQVAGYHMESLQNMPVAIIDHFADNNLNANKRAIISQAWQEMEPKDLLAFLRAYAISTTFHQHHAYKYYNAFDRNLIVQNMNTLSNKESFSRKQSLFKQLKAEGAEVFHPAHDVFGGQTGLQAANNPNIFKAAYSRNVQQPQVLGETERTYVDSSGTSRTWNKNWAAAIPDSYRTAAGYSVKKVGKWLWKRFIADGGRNFDIQAQAQVYAMLAEGVDFAYLASQTYPGVYSADQAFTTEALRTDPDLHALFHQLKAATIDLDSTDPLLRKAANDNMGLAVNFITATPYIFALEGE